MGTVLDEQVMIAPMANMPISMSLELWTVVIWGEEYPPGFMTTSQSILVIGWQTHGEHVWWMVHRPTSPQILIVLSVKLTKIMLTK